MIKLSHITILVFFLTGCSTANSVNVTSAVTPPSSISIGASDTVSPSPTVFVTLTASEIPVRFQEVFEACVEVDIPNESGVHLKDIAVFDNLSPDLVTTVYLHDLETSNLRTLSSPGVFHQFWGISPDRKYILYEYENLSGEDSDYRLAVTDFRGQIIKDFDNQFPNDPYSANYYNWQNDENIRVVLFSESHQAYKMSPRLFNPFTGDYRILQTDFPEYISKDLDWGLDWIALDTLHLEGANIVYDQLLTRVLYPKNHEIVSLMNVESGEELASIHLPHWGRLPKWSPSGESLALIAAAESKSPEASDEFFVVSKDGREFKRLTYLSNTFQQSAISNYAWSTDGKHIAFWLYSHIGDPNAEGTESELMILDVETGKVTSLCIQGISAVTSLESPVLFASTEPIWSPDANQIMISQWDSTQSNRSFNVLVVDLENLIAIKINENKQPAGWMIKEP